MQDGKAISGAYRRAGNDFLAQRLEGMFRVLKTPEDIALHNVIQKEIMLMVGDEPIQFYRALAFRLLDGRKKARRKFRRWVAEAIMGVSKG